MFIETKRTYLRAFQLDDFEDLKNMMSDQEVMKYTGFKEPQSLERITELLDGWIQAKDVWAAVEKGSERLIGWFMLKKTNTEFLEIGFMISREFWGQGHATEIGKALLSYGLKDLNQKKIIAKANKENRASLAVLTKLGMVKSDSIFEDGLVCFEINE